MISRFFQLSIEGDATFAGINYFIAWSVHYLCIHLKYFFWWHHRPHARPGQLGSSFFYEDLEESTSHANQRPPKLKAFRLGKRVQCVEIAPQCYFYNTITTFMHAIDCTFFLCYFSKNYASTFPFNIAFCFVTFGCTAQNHFRELGIVLFDDFKILVLQCAELPHSLL